MNKMIKMTMLMAIAFCSTVTATESSKSEKKEILEPKTKSELFYLAEGCNCPNEMIRRNTEEAKRKRAEREAKRAEEEAQKANS